MIQRARWDASLESEESESVIPPGLRPNNNETFTNARVASHRKVCANNKSTLLLLIIVMAQFPLLAQNFETVVLEGTNLMHYWKDTNGANPWRSAELISSRATGPASLIQSNFGTIGNFEAVVQEGSNLVHYWRDTANGGPWFRAWPESAAIITSRATGPGSIIQSTFGAHGNFEVLALEGANLVHYWKDTSNGGNPWQRGAVITSKATGPGSLIQSKGYFEVVVPEGTNLVHYWKDTSDGSSSWQRAEVISARAAGPGSIIQSGFDAFEVVALEDMHCAPSTAIAAQAIAGPTVTAILPACITVGNLVHYWKPTSHDNNVWQRVATITAGASGPASLIQSSFGPNGNFEALVLEGTKLVHFWKDTSNANNPWRRAEVVSSAATAPAPLLASCFSYQCAIDLKHTHFALQLGAPVSDYRASPDRVKFIRDYEFGFVSWSTSTGASVVYGAIAGKYAQLGRESSVLGYPRTDELNPNRYIRNDVWPVRYNDFDRGRIVWDSYTAGATGGAHELHGPIFQKYLSLPPYSGIGTPITDELPASRGGRYNDFEGGPIYWHPTFGAHYISAPEFFDKWKSMGGVTGKMGYPQTDTYVTPLYYKQDFEGGFLAWGENGDYDHVISHCRTSGPGCDKVMGSTADMGIRGVQLFNCEVDRHTLFIWMYDFSAPGWQSKGSITPQYDNYGACPAAGSRPVTLTLQPGHYYQLVAADPAGFVCGGVNDPGNVSCQRWSWVVLGSSSGPLVPVSVN